MLVTCRQENGTQKRYCRDGVTHGIPKSETRSRETTAGGAKVVSAMSENTKPDGPQKKPELGKCDAGKIDDRERGRKALQRSVMDQHDSGTIYSSRAVSTLLLSNGVGLMKLDEKLLGDGIYNANESGGKSSKARAVAPSSKRKLGVLRFTSTNRKDSEVSTGSTSPSGRSSASDNNPVSSTAEEIKQLVDTKSDRLAASHASSLITNTEGEHAHEVPPVVKVSNSKKSPIVLDSDLDGVPSDIVTFTTDLTVDSSMDCSLLRASGCFASSQQEEKISVSRCNSSKMAEGSQGDLLERNNWSLLEINEDVLDQTKEVKSNSMQGTGIEESDVTEDGDEGLVRVKRMPWRISFPRSFDGLYSGYTLLGNVPHGFGTMQMDCGDMYVGPFENGDMHGPNGIYQSASGTVYKGDFERNRKHGSGSENMHDGSQYVGRYENDVRHGFGVLFDASGSIVYGGLWKDGKFVAGGSNLTDDIENQESPVPSTKPAFFPMYGDSAGRELPSDDVSVSSASTSSTYPYSMYDDHARETLNDPITVAVDTPRSSGLLSTRRIRREDVSQMPSLLQMDPSQIDG